MGDSEDNTTSTNNVIVADLYVALEPNDYVGYFTELYILGPGTGGFRKFGGPRGRYAKEYGYSIYRKRES